MNPQNKVKKTNKKKIGRKKSLSAEGVTKSWKV